MTRFYWILSFTISAVNRREAVSVAIPRSDSQIHLAPARVTKVIEFMHVD